MDIKHFRKLQIIFLKEAFKDRNIVQLILAGILNTYCDYLASWGFVPGSRAYHHVAGVCGIILPAFSVPHNFSSHRTKVSPPFRFLCMDGINIDGKLRGRKKCCRKGCTSNRIEKNMKQNPFKRLGDIHEVLTAAVVRTSWGTMQRLIQDLGSKCVQPLLEQRQ